MFSVIIPLYNKGNYIERCIRSVYNQTYKEFEVIVIDDGSTDESTLIVENLKFKNLQLIKQVNQGVSVARNRGIERAINPYIAFLDADDFWHPNYLEMAHQVILNNSNVQIIGTHYTREEQKWKDTGHLDYYRIQNYFSHAIRTTLFLTSSTIIRKSFFEQNLHFNPLLTKGEDLDVWFRAVLNSDSIFYIKNTLVFYSNEDLNQLTKKQIPIESSLIGSMQKLYSDLRSSNESFSIFIDKYIYFNLYEYYYTPEHRDLAKKIIRQIKHKFLFAHIVYCMPSFIHGFLFKKKHWIRRYLKFVFRYITK